METEKAVVSTVIISVSSIRPRPFGQDSLSCPVFANSLSYFFDHVVEN